MLTTELLVDSIVLITIIISVRSTVVQKNAWQKQQGSMPKCRSIAAFSVQPWHARKDFSNDGLALPSHGWARLGLKLHSIVLAAAKGGVVGLCVHVSEYYVVYSGILLRCSLKDEFEDHDDLSMCAMAQFCTKKLKLYFFALTKISLSDLELDTELFGLKHCT